MLCIVPLVCLGLCQYWPKEDQIWDSDRSTLWFSILTGHKTGFRIRKLDKRTRAYSRRDYASSELGLNRLVGNPDLGPFAIVRETMGGMDHYGSSHILQPNLTPILKCREVWEVGIWGALISDVKDVSLTNLRYVELGKVPRERWKRPYEGLPHRINARRIGIKSRGLVIDAKTGKTVK